MYKFFCLLICLLATTYLDAADLNTALQQLTKKPYVDFDLGLTSHEKKLLEQVKVNSIENAYDNYGDFDDIAVDLTLFFQSMGNDYNVSSKAAYLVAKLVRKIVKELGSESFWLTLRPQTYVTRFDLPRWHQDGFYYHPHKPTPKVILSLKGAATLFCNLSKQDVESFRAAYYKVADSDLQLYYGETVEGRQELTRLIDASKIHQAEPYMGTVIIAGGDDATIYSEPPIHGERIFISILPGTKEQIKEWRSKPVLSVAR